MKQIFFILLALPFIAFPQKIKVSEYDQFLKQRRIETSTSILKSTVSTGLSICFKSMGNTYTVLLSGHGAAASTIGLDDQTIFLLDNDSTVIIKPTGVQAYDIGVGDKKNTYRHEYYISLGGLEALSRHNVKGIRKYIFQGHVNIDLAQKNRDLVKKLSTVFLNELIKQKVLYAETVIRLEDAAQHVGDTITVCGKIFTARYLENVDSKPTLLNMGAAYPNQLLTLVIYEADRKIFADTPESFYRGKEVCVTGKIELYQNKPQIVLRAKEQLIVKDLIPNY
jgi:hypothetical protein